MPEKFLVGGEWRSSDEVLDVVFPYDQSVVGSVYLASGDDIEEAIASAQKGFEITRKLPSYRRTEILQNLHRLMKERYEEIVNVLTLEGGKNKKTSRIEATRALQTIFVSSEEARRIGGEVFSVDWTPVGANRQGFTKRFPIGIVLAITPFNYPLNLGCHKVGPAIAAGNSVIVRPASQTPLSSIILGEMLLEAGFPPEAISVVPCNRKLAERMVADPRIAMFSFTGSASVGWMLKSKAGRKKLALELGGNAGIIVHEDADLNLAVRQSVSGAFANAGQNCISVQRLIVHHAIFDDFREQFVPAVNRLKVGDPRDEDTDIGPMIALGEAQRADAWIQEALEAGAERLVGGRLEGALLPPTVLTQVRPEMKVSCLEVFAPVVTLMPYQTWDEAVATVNDTEYGLQAGLFTRDIKLIMDAWERIDVGGLQVNDVSTFRVDHMPYGGVKDSGAGREGVKYAVEEMTELKLMVVNLA